MARMELFHKTLLSLWLKKHFKGRCCFGGSHLEDIQSIMSRKVHWWVMVAGTRGHLLTLSATGSRDGTRDKNLDWTLNLKTSKPFDPHLWRVPQLPRTVLSAGYKCSIIQACEGHFTVKLTAYLSKIKTTSEVLAYKKSSTRAQKWSITKVYLFGE